MIKLITDRYDGITVDSSTLPENKDKLHEELKGIIENHPDKKLLWIKIPRDKSELIPGLTELSFAFHHCDSNNLMLVNKLNGNRFIPTAPNFTTGVGAVVLNEKRLLVIRNRLYPGYMLPGGHIDDNEKIVDALKREIDEETGIKIEFESIISIGHFPFAQFDAANLYIVCTAKALSNKIEIYDTEEITEAKWIDVTEFLHDEETNDYNKNLVKTALQGTEFKLKSQDLTLKAINAELFF